MRVASRETVGIALLGTAALAIEFVAGGLLKLVEPIDRLLTWPDRWAKPVILSDGQTPSTLGGYLRLVEARGNMECSARLLRLMVEISPGGLSEPVMQSEQEMWEWLHGNSPKNFSVDLCCDEV